MLRGGNFVLTQVNERRQPKKAAGHPLGGFRALHERRLSPGGIEAGPSIDRKHGVPCPGESHPAPVFPVSEDLSDHDGWVLLECRLPYLRSRRPERFRTRTDRAFMPDQGRSRNDRPENDRQASILSEGAFVGSLLKRVTQSAPGVSSCFCITREKHLVFRKIFPQIAKASVASIWL
jgi:hypothetical protein